MELKIIMILLKHTGSLDCLQLSPLNYSDLNLYHIAILV
jgi:hypothetical protein